MASSDAERRVRLLHPWEVIGDPLEGPRIVFERRVYGGDGTVTGSARESLEATLLATPLRLALPALVVVGKLSPADARAIGEEAGLDAGRKPATIRDCLGALHRALPTALDDPMRGVLTTPLHHGLFGPDCGLLTGFDRLLSRSPSPAQLGPLDYARFYVRCRRTLLHVGMGLARALPAFPPGTIPPGVDVFAWWRTRWTQPVPIDLGGGEEEEICLPADLPATHRDGIARAASTLAQEHAAFAAVLGRPPTATREFVRAFVAELLDGTVNLLLNERARERCPRADQIELALERPHRFPSRAKVAKLVRIEGEPFEDCFGRFFTIGDQRLRLPRTGKEIAVWQLGGCPFPDQGSMPASDDPGRPDYCPQREAGAES